MAFPHIHVQRPLTSKTALAAVRDMFQNNGDVAVNEDRLGIIRIRIGSVPNIILQARISRVAFDPTSQYNPALAIDAIIAAPEVQSAAVSSNIRIPPMLFNILTVQPAAGLPHLLPTIINATWTKFLT